MQYLEETLKKTTFSTLKVGDFVNLEPSLTLSSLVGGHLVTGHVDTIGRIIAFDRGHPWGSIRISFDAQFSGLIVEKGSICINGIALTLVDIALNEFSLELKYQIFLSQPVVRIKKKLVGIFQTQANKTCCFCFYQNSTTTKNS